MHSSTSSSNSQRHMRKWRRLVDPPRTSGSRVLVYTGLLFCFLFAVWEVGVRLVVAPGIPGGAIREPRTEQDGWIWSREGVAHAGNNDWVIIGDSVSMAAIVPERLREVVGANSVTQLGIPATSPLPILHDLAEEKEFAGVVVLGVTPQYVCRDTSEKSREWVAQYQQRFSFGHIQKTVESLIQHVIRLPFIGLSQRLSLYQQFGRFVVLPRLEAQAKVLAAKAAAAERLSVADRESDIFGGSDHEEEEVAVPLEENSVIRIGAFEDWAAQMGFWLSSFWLPNRRLIVTTEYSHLSAVLATARGENAARDNKRHPIGWGLDARRIVSEIVSGLSASAKTIRERGGSVILVRMPESPAFNETAESFFPQEECWDRLLKEGDVPGVHYQDHPDMLGFFYPDGTHVAGFHAVTLTEAIGKHLLDVRSAEQTSRRSQGW